MYWPLSTADCHSNVLRLHRLLSIHEVRPRHLAGDVASALRTRSTAYVAKKAPSIAKQIRIGTRMSSSAASGWANEARTFSTPSLDTTGCSA